MLINSRSDIADCSAGNEVLLKLTEYMLTVNLGEVPGVRKMARIKRTGGAFQSHRIGDTDSLIAKRPSQSPYVRRTSPRFGFRLENVFGAADGVARVALLRTAAMMRIGQGLDRPPPAPGSTRLAGNKTSTAPCEAVLVRWETLRAREADQ
jgi:hypothetical protein